MLKRPKGRGPDRRFRSQPLRPSTGLRPQPSRVLFACFILICLAGRVPAASSTATNNPSQGSKPRFEFDAFRLITERNIFNPLRSERGDNRRTTVREERRVRRDSFALLGTMSYEKGRFAFFDGSEPDYRKVLQPEQNIAGFKITSVAPTCVKLETTNGQTIDLCVGMQMSKQEEEDWRLSESLGAGSSNATSGTNGVASDEVTKRLLQRREQEAGPAAAPSVAPTTTAPVERPFSGEANEIVRRLLQKREQELNK
jgi:hypothetical protein